MIFSLTHLPAEEEDPDVLVYPKDTPGGVTLRLSDIGRLKDEELFNDSLIDFWLRSNSI